MKKIIALVLCFAVLFTLSLTAFATSPSADEKYSVTLRKGDSGNDAPTTVNNGDTVTATADTSYGTFNNWKIYKKNADGSATEAVPGVDYDLAEGTTLNATTIKVKPKTDIYLCANYNNTVTDPLAPSSSSSVYKIIKGADSKWEKGSGKDLLIASNADFSKFVSVKVDGNVIAASNYTAVSGSTEVTFKNAYLETLSTGTHTVTIVSNDGDASTTLTINPKGDSPKTADNSIVYVVMMLVAAMVVFGAKKVYSK